MIPRNVLGEEIAADLELVATEFARKPDHKYGMGMRAMGESIYDESAPTITYDGRQSAARKRLEETLLSDLRFEHLKNSDGEELTWKYASAVGDESEAIQAIQEITDEIREPSEGEFWFWLEQLTAPTRFKFSGVEFVPADQYFEPVASEPSDPRATLVLTTERGTNPDLMRARARKKVDAALKRLRIALDEDREIHSDQLRFYIGHRYGFPDGTVGLRRVRGTALHLEISEKQVADAAVMPLGDLPLVPANDVEQQIAVATNWLDRAMLADEIEIAMLFRFFALEALFAKKKDKKGLGKLLTIRRATLGLIVEGKYMSPFFKPHLYNKVRSKAVHGEVSATFPEKLANSLAWDTRKALLEYVQFARDGEFTERWKVLDALDASERRGNVLRTLQHNDPETWGEYE